MRRIEWSEKQRQILSMPYKHTLEVNEGTPRSGKTTCGVARTAWFYWNTPDQNHLILAYNQEQAYRLVMDCDGLGILHKFPGICSPKQDNFGKYVSLITPNGEKKIYYKGGGKADSPKAFTGMSFGSVYFCEINLLHMNAIQEAFRRTMAAKIRWHIADLNPPSPSHPVISEVFDIQDTLWTHWTPMDNPALTPDRRKELHDTLIKSQYLYRRDWLGERVIPEGVIYSMFDPSKHILDKMPDDARPIEMVFFGDGGLTDATSISCNIICSTKDGPKMFRVANWYYGGTNKAMSTQAKEIAEKFAPYCRNKYNMQEDMWYIDPACKGLRKELELYGIETMGADNNARDVNGSRKGIEVGIEYFQNMLEQKKILLVNDDVYGHANFEKEIGMYCVDDHGHPVDAYNHCCDEARYASNYFVKNFVY